MLYSLWVQIWLSLLKFQGFWHTILFSEKFEKNKKYIICAEAAKVYQSWVEIYVCKVIEKTWGIIISVAYKKENKRQKLKQNIRAINGITLFPPSANACVLYQNMGIEDHFLWPQTNTNFSFWNDYKVFFSNNLVSVSKKYKFWFWHVKSFHKWFSLDFLKLKFFFSWTIWTWVFISNYISIIFYGL